MNIFRKIRNKQKKEIDVNVQIKTTYGEMAFDMPQDKVLSLISLAITYAKGDETRAPDTLPREVQAEVKSEEQQKNEKEPPAPPVEKPAPKSRLESIFGKRSEWNLPADMTEDRTAQNIDSRDGDAQEGYRGFLYIECEKCGKTKGFCVKHSITHHQCECGHKTELRNLLPAHVRCECDKRFTYHTNVQSNVFTIDCLSCGSPVDMELGAKAKAFVTIGRTGGKA